MREFILKTDPAVFKDVLEGRKTFEIRFNDRGYQVGDLIVLKETKFTGQQMGEGSPLIYTGREMQKQISYILSGYGLQDGWVILGIIDLDNQQAIINDLKAQLECCRKENAVLLGKVGELQERIDTTKSSQSKLHKTEMGDCLHFNTTMFHEGKATCFECDAVVNHKRKVIGVMQTRTLRGKHD